MLSSIHAIAARLLQSNDPKLAVTFRSAHSRADGAPPGMPGGRGSRPAPRRARDTRSAAWARSFRCRCRPHTSHHPHPASCAAAREGEDKVGASVKPHRCEPAHAREVTGIHAPCAAPLAQGHKQKREKTGASATRICCQRSSMGCLAASVPPYYAHNSDSNCSPSQHGLTQ